MFKLTSALFLAAALSGCTTLSPQTKELLRQRPGASRSYVPGVRFIGQAEGDCGPTSLAMALDWAGTFTPVEALRGEVLTPQKKGALPTDLVTASRRRGFMSIQLSTMDDLVRELSGGHPVIVLQNLGFSWLPQWHYAVVLGYDFEDQVFIMHSGNKENLKMPMTYFERHWKLADNWGLLVLRPNDLSASGDELAHMRAAAGLEAVGQHEAARKAYTQILKRWPQSFAALIGLGNVAYAQKQYQSAIQFLEKAKQINPGSKVIQNNLQVVKTALQKENFSRERESETL